MKIMAQEEYGVRCLLRFARAGVEQWLTIPEIAAAEKLSVPYVAKLLAVLRQGGFVESARGRSGGYHLAAAPADIGLGAVLRVLGEPLFDDPGYCERHSGSESGGDCVHRESCTLRVLWRGLEKVIQCLLDRMTLADLLQNERHIQELMESAIDNIVPRAETLLPLIAKPRN
jgi:Rrf2 family transcriptional regulator, iron-sulfur cluster assembly transcription factor